MDRGDLLDSPGQVWTSCFQR